MTTPLAAALHAIPSLYAALDAITTSSGGQGERVSGSREPPLPPGMAGICAADDLLGLVISWEDAVRDLLGYPRRPRRGRPAHNLLRSCGWLRGQMNVIVDSDLFDDLDREIRSTVKAARRQLSGSALTHHLPAPCPRCDYRSLVRRDGEDEVRCMTRDCAAVWEPDEYAWLVLVLAASTSCASCPRPAAVVRRDVPLCRTHARVVPV